MTAIILPTLDELQASCHAGRSRPVKSEAWIEDKEKKNHSFPFLLGKYLLFSKL